MLMCMGRSPKKKRCGEIPFPARHHLCCCGGDDEHEINIEINKKQRQRLVRGDVVFAEKLLPI